MINVSIVDDHKLVMQGLSSLINNLGYTVLSTAENGKEFINNLDKNHLPDLVLMDISMPEMNGFETTKWCKENYPEIKVLALSGSDVENSIIRMLNCGARGYILKDCDAGELQHAILSIINNGYHFNDLVNNTMVHDINSNDVHNLQILNNHVLNDKELEFMKWICTELTYKEIAAKMFLSPRTIDGYREKLFEKLNVKTRVGLALYAIKNNICEA